MILDPSAVVAVAVGEPGCERIVQTILAAQHPGMGAPSAVELAIVLDTRFPGRGEAVARALLDRLGVTVLPFPAHLWPAAHAAYTRFGRGRHPARLNFGDCLSYAVAKAAGLPLLCVGADFPQTDLELVLLPA